MAYATVVNVENLNSARIFTTTSKPSTEEVIDFLEGTAAELDSLFLEQGYGFPLASGYATQARTLLKHYNAMGAYAWSERSAEISPHRDQAWDAWQTALKAIRDGRVSLVDADRDTNTANARSGGVATPFFYRLSEF